MKDNKTNNDRSSEKYYKNKNKTKEEKNTPESKTFVIKYAHKLLISCQNI